MSYSKFIEQKPLNYQAKRNESMEKTIDKKYVKNDSKREIIFKVKPDIQNDIYYLYSLNNDNKEEYYDIALIPDFTTSVMMNKLFRKIKENANLDALEESDDEEDFENEKEDRFVYLDKTYNMVCLYNYKFKKWYPIRIADSNTKITTLNNIKR